MNLNKQQLAKEIDAYVALKARENALALQAARHAQMIKQAGGGESKKWRAALVKVARKVVIVKAHKQLRVYPIEK